MSSGIWLQMAQKIRISYSPDSGNLGYFGLCKVRKVRNGAVKI